MYVREAAKKKSSTNGIFTCLLQYFQTNRAILVPKLWGEKKVSKPVFGHLRLKKIRWPLSSRGGKG